ncbi:MAG: hypothetical protein WC998_06405 [Candidatus Paceibacterota bacterium]|jgi:hypothetical protein
MKKLIFFFALLLLASCQERETVEMSAEGQGEFTVNYQVEGQWTQVQVNDFWQEAVRSVYEDTIKLNAYANEYPVELHIDSIGVVIMPKGFLEMKFIIR